MGGQYSPSIGVGSEIVFDESFIYKAKDLSLIIRETIAVDAAQYRGWKNAFLTKASSIDKTRQSQILQWLLQAFSPDVTREMLVQSSSQMPRLDAHLASILMEAKRLKGEFGLQFQAHTESEQMRGHAPLGRVLLNMIAKQFFLDQSRGVNLTQQSLPELDITQFTPQGLSSFVDRVEYMLNSIPPELQRPEMTRYTWLYPRMRKVRVMHRHIDRICDSRVGSHCRTYDWLFGKLKTCIKGRGCNDKVGTCIKRISKPKGQGKAESHSAHSKGGRNWGKG